MISTCKYVNMAIYDDEDLTNIIFFYSLGCLDAGGRKLDKALWIESAAYRKGFVDYSHKLGSGDGKFDTNEDEED